MSRKPLSLITGEPAHSPFAHYLSEILCVEGYLCYDGLDLREAELSAADLEGASVALLGDVRVSEHAMGLLSEFVSGGGVLVAMRPRGKLAELCGLRRLQGMYSQASDVYLSAQLAHPWLQGFPAACLQFHGDADIYEPRDGEALALLAGRPDSASPYPAVFARKVGQGCAVAFAFDLAASVVLTRQGVPREKAYDGDPDRDRDGMFKPNDFFIGYLDPDFRLLPQADLQQEVLVRVLRHASARPLPRIWYFPAPSPAGAVVRGDSDGMSRADFDRTLGIAEEYGARYTIQMMEEHLDLLSRSEAEALRERGHDVGVHPIYPAQPTIAEATEILERLARAFEGRYGFPATSHVAHSHLFPGWAQFPQQMAQRGMAVTFDFATGRYFREGYLNGSGLPARFVGEDGRLINVFQHATLQGDDGYLTPKVLLAPMSSDEAAALTRRVIQDCLRFNTLYHCCCHPVRAARDQDAEQFLRCIAGELRRLSIPTFGAHQWAEFNRRRRGLSLTIEEAGADRRALCIEGTGELPELTVLLPEGCEVKGVPATPVGLIARGQEWTAVHLSPEGRDSMELRFSR